MSREQRYPRPAPAKAFAAAIAASTLTVAGLALAVAGCATEKAADTPSADTPTADHQAGEAAVTPEGGPEAAGGFRGLELTQPIAVPDFTLPDTDGHPYDFVEQTAGSLSFLFFGFTHCPDICPVQLSNLTAALGDLPYAQRRQIDVIFVSTDPDRDTPDVLRAWLDHFDPGIVGLVDDLESVNAVLASLDLPPAVREDIPGSDDYRMGHIAQVMAITGDGLIRFAYPGGVRQADWRNDLPRLLALNASVVVAPGG